MMSLKEMKNHVRHLYDGRELTCDFFFHVTFYLFSFVIFVSFFHSFILFILFLFSFCFHIVVMLSIFISYFFL